MSFADAFTGTTKLQLFEVGLTQEIFVHSIEYNAKFRNVNPLPSEDADAFISRLEMVIDKWVELSGIEKGNYMNS